MPRPTVVLLAVTVLLGMSDVWVRADTSSSSSSWPTNQALPHFAAPQHLDVADVSSLPGDQQLLFNTLEGLVNRVQPRIYLLWAADEGNRTWLDTLKTEFGVPFTDRGSTWDTLRTYLLGTYGSSISGMIVYDPSVPDSINVATTLAGVDNAVVASPALATTLAAPPFNLKVVDDLRGKFLSR